MDLYIKRIEIKNFRSIKKLSLDMNKVSLLIGKNDVGKSNILRALNLFFNNEVDYLEKLNFDRDFYVDGKRKGKADEISVVLDLHLPQTYKANGDFVRWKKTWRRDKETTYSDSYVGYRVKINRLKKEKLVEVRKLRKTNLGKLLSRINFRYIPANKNSNYFDELRGEIYKTIASDAGGSFEKTSKSFEKDIEKHIKELTGALKGSLGFDSHLKLPNDLTSIFEKLEFIDPIKKIQLNQRGDGIKSRHIPHILNFMAEKQKGLVGKGAPRYTVIWGYEEPENNLEITSCIELMNEIFLYIGRNISQCIATTHSPAIYNVVKENQESGMTHSIVINDGDRTTEISKELDVFRHIGATALYAKEIESFQKDLEEKSRNIEILKEEIKNEQKHRIYVEGLSDKILLEKAVDAYQLDFSNIILCTKRGGGDNYVYDMVKQFKLFEKHEKTGLRVAGILDEDAKSKIKDQDKDKSSNSKYGKCFPYEFCSSINSQKRYFSVSLSLEHYYCTSIWEYAEGKGWLEVKEKTDYYKKSDINKILDGDDSGIQEVPIFISHKFNSGSNKVACAKYLSRKSNDEFLDLVDDKLKEVLLSIKSFLNS